MTTAEIIEKLRDMEAQCIDAPKSKQFFSETREHLETYRQLLEEAVVDLPDEIEMIGRGGPRKSCKAKLQKAINEL